MATFSVESGRAEENSNYVYFTVRLSSPLSYDATVEYQTSSCTAISGTDFDQRNLKLTFSAGEVEKTFYVHANSDALVESDESFFVELFNPVGATFGDRNLTLRTAGWILDDDVSGGQRALAVVAPVVSESAGQATFALSLSEAFSTDTTVSYQTVPGSAAAGADFTARTGSVTFGAGETEATVSVALKADKAVEPGETFGLKVAGAGLGAFGTTTIVNDDRPRPVVMLEVDRAVESSNYIYVTARLSEASTSEVTLDYQTFSGSALSGTDFDRASKSLTFAAGETEKSFYVRAASDTDRETDEAFGIELWNPVGASFGGSQLSLRRSGWILDDEPGGGQRALDVSAPVVEEASGRAIFTVTVSEAFASDTTLRYATVAGSAKAGDDFIDKAGSITFAEGQTEATVSIALKNDRVSEAGEAFDLKVWGNGIAGAGQAQILDSDAARPVISLQGESAVEYYGYHYFTARLSEAARTDVTVQYQTINGTALAGSDFNAAGGNLTFAAGETVTTFYVRANSDSLSERDESFGVSLSNATGAGFGPGLSGATATGWILDDDAGTDKRVIRVSDVTVTEDAGLAHFTISVSRPLDDDLAIRFKTESVSAKAGRDFRPDSGAVTLAEGATEATVSIRITDDRAHEGSETFRLKITSLDPGRDFASAGLDLVGVARITDDDGGRSAHFLHDALL